MTLLAGLLVQKGREGAGKENWEGEGDEGLESIEESSEGDHVKSVSNGSLEFEADAAIAIFKKSELVSLYMGSESVQILND